MSKMFTILMTAYNETLDQLQTEDFSLVNTRDLPPEAVKIKTLELQTLSYKANLLKEEIVTEAFNLGKENIEDFDSFAISFRNKELIG